MTNKVFMQFGQDLDTASKRLMQTSSKSKLGHTGKTRRVQSAKARLTNDKHDMHHRMSNSEKGARPISAQNNCKYVSSSDQLQIDGATGVVLEPHVYGYTSKATVCGNDTCDTGENIEYPYRLTEDDTLLEDYEDLSSDDFIYVVDDRYKSAPKCLNRLLPWATDNAPVSWTGVDPQNCLVFLPSLSQQQDDLPVVPSTQQADDDLVYEKIIVPPPPRVVKKYPHYHSLMPKEDGWVCSHGRSKLSRDASSSLLEIYSRDGQVIHRSGDGSRTADVVRKEIQELEDLMKGIGADDGISVVVRMQAEINKVQSMLDNMAERLQEIDEREEERLIKATPPDHFGLRQFYKKHDEVIAQIKQQQEFCIQELAVIETDLGLESDRKYFDKQKQMMNLR